MRIGALAVFCVAVGAVAAPCVASAQSTCIVGEVKWWPREYEPQKWRFANGQLLTVNQNQFLFALFGYTYGGGGSTFALPDLRNRMVIGTGQGPGLTNRTLAEVGGADRITLTREQMPAHTHTVLASGDPPIATDPGGNVWAENPRSRLYDMPGLGVDMSAFAIGTTGNGQPHDNVMPYQALNPIICTEGIFPSAN